MYLNLVVVEGFSVVSFDLLANHCLQSNLVVLFIVVVVDGIESIVVDGVGVEKVFVVDVVNVVEVDRVVTVVVEDDVVDKIAVVGDEEVVVVVDDDGNVIALVDHLFVVAETSSSCHPNVGINVVSSSCQYRIFMVIWSRSNCRVRNVSHPIQMSRMYHCNKTLCSTPYTIQI